MDDIQPTPAEPVEATTEQDAPVQDAPAEDAAETTPQAPVIDWRKALDEAPAEELRRHPKFAGIVGSEKQSWEQDYRARKQAEDAAAARAQAEEELRELAEKNPVAFADKWLSSEEARAQAERVKALEVNARQQVGTAVGAAMQAIPEWEDIAKDPEALVHLATALQGKTEDAVLPAWNTAAIELVANRRAQRLLEQTLEARIKAERAAWETEAAAQGFRFSDRPDLVRGGRLATADPEPDFRRQPAEWNAWWDRNK